jgi:STE24 endopeptidase
MRLYRLALALCLVLPVVLSGCDRETPAEHAANVYAAQEMAAAPVHGNLPDYSLPPDKLAKAQHLSSIETTLHCMGVVWGIAQIALLLWLGVVAWMRDRAVAVGDRLRAKGQPVGAKWLEGFLFALLFLAATLVLNLPLRLYGHHLSVAYGFSIQGWPGWLGDLGKGFAIEWVEMGMTFMLLFLLIRHFPRRWWLVFWAVLAPIILFMTYLQPLLIDPLFNTFEPLAKTQPQLVEQLQKVVARGHMDIPPDRMFLMKASAKTTQMNAYVTGFGGSKRLVLWDTMLTKATPDEVLMVFGHESGHYVLGHVTRGILETLFGLFAVIYIGCRLLGWSLRRFGTRWRIPAQSDWGAMAILLLILAVFSAISEPVINTLSRQVEHAADVYGQEAIHGIVADPQAAAQGLDQVLGENSLADPNPSPWVEFWLYNHPAIGRRAAFARVYDPWTPGMEPKYFKK